jgi:hypothetical protein
MTSSESSRVPFDTKRYARRSQEGPCFVCAILAGERPHHEVYEDADTIAFLARPVTLLGYCIVAPKRHVEDWVHEMDEDEFLALQRVVRRVAAAVSEVVPTCTGMSRRFLPAFPTSASSTTRS